MWFSQSDYHIMLIITFLSIFSADMLESNNLVTFEGLANSSSYHTFLLDEEKGRLVVGAKDHIFSFNLLNISRDYTQVKPLFGFQRVCLVASSVHTCIMSWSLFAFLTNVITALSVHPKCQPGAQVSRDFVFCFYWKKNLINISDKGCRTRSHAVPGMLAALCTPG